VGCEFKQDACGTLKNVRHIAIDLDQFNQNFHRVVCLKNLWQRKTERMMRSERKRRKKKEERRKWYWSSSFWEVGQILNYFQGKFQHFLMWLTAVAGANEL
jgi:hypothetical protein